MPFSRTHNIARLLFNVSKLPTVITFLTFKIYDQQSFSVIKEPCETDRVQRSNKPHANQSRLLSILSTLLGTNGIRGYTLYESRYLLLCLFSVTDNPL